MHFFVLGFQGVAAFGPPVGDPTLRRTIKLAPHNLRMRNRKKYHYKLNLLGTSLLR